MHRPVNLTGKTPFSRSWQRLFIEGLESPRLHAFVISVNHPPKLVESQGARRGASTAKVRSQQPYVMNSAERMALMGYGQYGKPSDAQSGTSLKYPQE